MGEKKQKRAKRDEAQHSMKVGRGSTLLSDNLAEVAGVYYRPKTQETRQTYEVLLAFIQEALGDQPRDILAGAADEVIRAFKDDRKKDKEKKVETEELLGSRLAEELFALLVNLGKKITDFGTQLGDDDEDENIDETYGINVQFQESDEEMEDEDGGQRRGYGGEVDSESDDNEDEEDEEENED